MVMAMDTTVTEGQVQLRIQYAHKCMQGHITA